ncbi:MAG: HD domain-containing phosphohydrolase [Melioribacteraceae bacterium]
MHKILLVDDDDNILQGYKRNLRNRFLIYTATDPRMALSILEVHSDFSVIVSDYNMPEMNGISFLTKAKELRPDTVRILITGYADLQMAIKSVNEGNLFRFLTKPCEQQILQSVLTQGCDQYKLITSEKELLERTLKGSIKVLIDILAVSNSAVFNRSLLIKDYAKKIMKRLGMPDSWEVEIACLLSQIGCIGIPNEILEKRLNGIKLNNEEEEMFLSQAGAGKTLLKNIPRLEHIADGISMQYLSYNDVCLKKEQLPSESLRFIPAVLRVLNDYYSLIERGEEEQEAIKFILEEKEQYDPRIIGIMEAQIAGVEDGYTVKSIQLSELKAGMILAADMFDKKKFKILSKGTTLSEVYIMKLLNYSKVGGIVEPIKIITNTE